MTPYETLAVAVSSPELMPLSVAEALLQTARREQHQPDLDIYVWWYHPETNQALAFGWPTRHEEGCVIIYAKEGFNQTEFNGSIGAKLLAIGS